MKKPWKKGLLFALVLTAVGCQSVRAADATLRDEVTATMRKAATYYRTRVAVHGGYVYYYSLNLRDRWGEGRAERDEIWVQPPGTPAVGMAYLKAYEATGDTFYLDGAREAAEALVKGQHFSGGWSNRIPFTPEGRFVLDRQNFFHSISSLDDGQTQSVIRLLARVDRALGFRHKAIHDTAQTALNALLAAQFPNGAFPQCWQGPVAEKPVLKARYPEDDWRKQKWIITYWRYYTLNDDVPGYVAKALVDAHEVYGDERYLAALRRLGDFLLLAQMPDPQPAWAQQYNFEMIPVWARKFEPPAVSGDESQEMLETLLLIHRMTGDPKYLEPFPRALAYLRRSLLPDGRLARFYELKTNRPLYMVREGKVYTLTYDDSNVPNHYAWKVESRLDEIEAAYLEQSGAVAPADAVRRSPAELEKEVRKIIRSLDPFGRWISRYRGERLVGQPNFDLGYPFIASEVFCRNLETLSDYLIAAQSD